MSIPDAVVARRHPVPTVRPAVPVDHPAIREVVVAAYGQYAGALPPEVFPRYLADLLDLDRHARHERLAHGLGAPAFAFHTGSFMTGAIGLYERLGYRRAPEFDVDMNAYYGMADGPPTRAIAYVRRLLATAETAPDDPTLAVPPPGRDQRRGTSTEEAA